MQNVKNRVKFYDAIISNNSSVLGGGLYIEPPQPWFERTIIRDNSATKGGGIYVRHDQSRPKLINNLIYNNSATESGGAIHSLNRSIIKFFHSPL